MTQLTGKERATYVQNMFTRIAQRYDLMNRLMTGGQDIRWRKRVIELARLTSGASLLDLGTGTGDLAREALAQFPQANVIAADFTLEMMRVGKQNGALNFSTADALRLPFDDLSFDAVVSGFLMRNVIDLQKAIQEQHRILKNRGRIVILDTTCPKKNMLSPFIWLHMHVVKSEALIEEGYFGEEVSSRFRERVGNLVLLPYRYESVWWYEKNRFEQRFYGHHGGLTPQEMQTVLYAYEA